ncbi:hypothetical protein [Streptomyces sp. NPDC086787]|uniref:hypothetical protein n=1 Tax=Streptomyces sp. NPDC086787 TaxID=3365759 RepID=UPI00382F7AA7
MAWHELNVGAVFRPGDGEGDERAVWLIDSTYTPICEIPEGDARGLAIELAELLGLFVCDRGIAGEVVE